MLLIGTVRGRAWFKDFLSVYTPLAHHRNVNWISKPPLFKSSDAQSPTLFRQKHNDSEGFLSFLGENRSISLLNENSKGIITIGVSFWSELIFKGFWVFDYKVWGHNCSKSEQNQNTISKNLTTIHLIFTKSDILEFRTLLIKNMMLVSQS